MYKCICSYIDACLLQFSVCNSGGSDAQSEEAGTEVRNGLGSEHRHTESTSTVAGPKLPA